MLLEVELVVLQLLDLELVDRFIDLAHLDDLVLALTLLFLLLKTLLDRLQPTLHLEELLLQLVLLSYTGNHLHVLQLDYVAQGPGLELVLEDFVVVLLDQVLQLLVQERQLLVRVLVYRSLNSFHEVEPLLVVHFREDVLLLRRALAAFLLLL